MRTAIVLAAFYIGDSLRNGEHGIIFYLLLTLGVVSSLFLDYFENDRKERTSKPVNDPKSDGAKPL